MDLLQVKNSRPGTRWEDLEAASGIALGNLHNIARGLKGWGPETGAKLMKIGVDLNDQTRTYIAKTKERNEIMRKRMERAAERIAS